jgi:hypothetical protein
MGAECAFCYNHGPERNGKEVLLGQAALSELSTLQRLHLGGISNMEVSADEILTFLNRLRITCRQLTSLDLTFRMYLFNYLF